MKERIIKQITYFSRLIITEKKTLYQIYPKLVQMIFKLKRKANKQIKRKLPKINVWMHGFDHHLIISLKKECNKKNCETKL